ncbi:MAG: hypothetical protein A2991_04030 [Candidatus Terrybacteria bacterium RIFCSPLOWO2_01_FULL_58_14]|uniref:Rod shape-determining protein MreD n=2 Tax=Candidatus Terryibacteriota TaxID=1817920 RepID=A0A1G2Q116_9BACT|nr:MAG: hypothetical protein A2682_00720 [Candidatus Terrybacteria bacterium RIFCSPHIGHO2_01_FULL_58_15]OHA53532.1 MAG: hypothetical protein A2991_04030 [Candidatus Terrybacteria bacterium RIFCSPLOWO2_01_FULL_58_14]
MIPLPFLFLLVVGTGASTALSIHAAPWVWPVLFPFLFLLPGPARWGVFAAAGFMLDVFSGHVFGLGIFAALGALWFGERLRILLRSSIAARCFVGFSLAMFAPVFLVLAREVFAASRGSLEWYGSSLFVYAAAAFVGSVGAAFFTGEGGIFRRLMRR